MATLYYLENFNNYYNRTIKKPTSNLISDFEDYLLKSDTEFNFNPHDHVSTIIIVNYNYYENGVEYEINDEKNIDYVLVSDDQINVKSKWFVTDRVRTLGGQWQLTLRRDLISDYFEYVRRSPVYVEKGIISSVTNKLLLNSENITFNQIKKKEIPLNDKSATPWIVGYMAKNYLEDTNAPKTFETKFGGLTVSVDAEYSYSQINQEKFFVNYASALRWRMKPNAQQLGIDYKFTLGTSYFTEEASYASVPFSIYYDSPNAYNPETIARYNGYVNGFVMTDDQFNSLPLSQRNNCTAIDQETLNALMELEGKIIKNTDSSGPTYFRFNLSENRGNERISFAPAMGSRVFDSCVYQVLNGVGVYDKNIKYSSAQDLLNPFTVDVTGHSYDVSVYDLSNAAVSLKMDLTNSAAPLEDAPYIMFAMPWDDTSFQTGETTNWRCYGDASKAMAAEMAARLGSVLYDLQLLPFCPFPEVVIGDHAINITDDTVLSIADDRYAYITDAVDQSTIFGYILFPEISSQRVNVLLNEEDQILLPDNAVDFKVKHETEFVRIVSPNYSGAFQFKPMSNGGFANVEINFTYKPYQPYIHVNPTFNEGWLYGSDYNDSRGLICGGDFTLPQAQDQWANFLINNKSYMESFNRQIENMEVNNAVQREREIWSAVAGTVGGAAGGAMSGTMMGGGVAGAIVGGAVGGIAAAAGGIRDIQLAEKLRSEAIDYTKDQFGYNLQNIQALPMTMSRTSAFDINNKLFPFMEYYGCTEEEERIFKSKIQYNGMTIMAVDLIENYVAPEGVMPSGSYVKGKLIRFEGNAEPHEVSEIADELNKGVFV